MVRCHHLAIRGPLLKLVLAGWAREEHTALLLPLVYLQPFITSALFRTHANRLVLLLPLVAGLL